MKTIGYARVSTNHQDTQSQEHLILKYAHEHKLSLEEIVKVKTSSRKERKERLIDETLLKLNSGDTLLVYALDRLGRSTIETLQIVEDIKEAGIRLVIIKEQLVVDKNDTNPMNKMMLTMLTAVADLERGFISERVRAGLATAKAKGKKLGRKKGQQVKSIFDDHKDKIEELINLGVTNKRVHEYINVGTVQSLGKYINSRGLKNASQ